MNVVEVYEAFGYGQVIGLLPAALHRTLEGVSPEDGRRVTEIRLRAFRPVVLMMGSKSCFLRCDGSLTSVPDQRCVTLDKSALEKVFLHLCGWAVHTRQRELSLGFIPLAGGHRVGVGATAILQEGDVTGQREIHSLNLRVARQVYGVADTVLQLCFPKGVFGGVLLAGAPASGKTTVLRDAIRQLAGDQGGYRKVAVVDETGELAGLTANGVQNDLGITSDLVLGYPKHKGLVMALRYLSPQVIVCDEVADGAEIEGVVAAANSGVDVMTSIHGASMGELRRKRSFQRLWEAGAVRYVVLLSGPEQPCAVNEVVDLWQDKCLFRDGKQTDEGGLRR